MKDPISCLGKPAVIGVAPSEEIRSKIWLNSVGLISSYISQISTEAMPSPIEMIDLGEVYGKTEMLYDLDEQLFVTEQS